MKCLKFNGSCLFEGCTLKSRSLAFYREAPKTKLKTVGRVLSLLFAEFLFAILGTIEIWVG